MNYLSETKTKPINQKWIQTPLTRSYEWEYHNNKRNAEKFYLNVKKASKNKYLIEKFFKTLFRVMG